MFGLLTRSSRPRHAAARRYVRPTLERLEDRLAPTNQLTLSVAYDPHQQVTLSGQLTGSNTAGQVIMFGGAVKGSAVTDSNGQYSVTLQASSLGQVNAAEVAGQSNMATANLVSAIPNITFTASPEGNGVWLFSGTVTGAPTQGEVVNFGGITPLAGQSTDVNADGSFSFTCIVNEGQGGVATAQAVDWWGDSSAVAKDYVAV
jgi:hypothetical protein